MNNKLKKIQQPVNPYKGTQATGLFPQLLLCLCKQLVVGDTPYAQGGPVELHEKRPEQFGAVHGVLLCQVPRQDQHSKQIENGWREGKITNGSSLAFQSVADTQPLSLTSEERSLDPTSGSDRSVRLNELESSQVSSLARTDATKHTRSRA
jgi:hypothetical protein